MESIAAFIPLDRRRALASGATLPDRSQGAVLFADLSGYTALTQTFMDELGAKQGADHLTRHLNALFAALIAEVHGYGGSVIGFGGDALTCWFEADPGLHATACALAMQRVIGPLATLAIPSGKTFTLSLKVAVAAGSVRRFQVGHPDIQYFDVLAGLAIARTMLAEKQAGKGEVIVSAEVISQADGKLQVAEWRTVTGSTERMAVVAGLADEVQVETKLPAAEELPALSAAEAQPWLLRPVYERWQNGHGAFLADVRPVVALFMKFGGLDYEGDDQAGVKLDQYIRAVQTILSRHEGCMIKLTIGDKGSYLFATFGAPVTHDDDASRAIAAALDLRATPAMFPSIETVQIGISQGRMLAGAFGSAQRCAYDLLGDEVNVAARLMTAAQANQILVSQRVAMSAVKHYDFDYQRAIELKGKTERMPVLEPISGRPAPRPLFSTHLVGRDRELARINQALETVAAGQGQLLRLEGEAGIGKSHLAAEAAQVARQTGFRVVWGACDSTNRLTLYYPWQQIFRDLLGVSLKSEDETAILELTAQLESKIEAINPAWLVRVPLLGDLLGVSLPENGTTKAYTPQLRQEALRTLAVDLLKQLAQSQPLLLVIEDIHWLDEASAGLLAALSRMIETAPLGLVLTHRPLSGENGDQQISLAMETDGPGHHLRLTGLTEAGLAALLEERLGGHLNPLALALIQGRTQGNPFYAEELTTALRQSGGLLYQRYKKSWTLSKGIVRTLRRANCLSREPISGEWRLAQVDMLANLDLGLPNTIQQLILARYQRLAEPLWLTLRTASVIGRAFSLEVLHRAYPKALPVNELLAQLSDLEDQAFIHREEAAAPQLRYAFKHHLIQEAIYDTLVQEQQRQLHQAVAEALAGTQPQAVEQIAYHYLRTDCHEKTLAYLDLAAHKSQGEYANEAALGYYNQALALAEQLGQVNWTRRRGQIEVLHGLGRREEEAQVLLALATQQDVPAFDEAFLWGRYFEAIGDYGQAQVAMERALVACHNQNDVIGQADCLNQLGLIAWKRNLYDEAQEKYQQALRLTQSSEAISDSSRRVMAQSLNGLGTLYRQQGNFSEAARCYEQALPLCRERGNVWEEARTIDNLGSIAYHRRRFDEARAFHQQAVELWRTMGDRSREGASLYNLALDWQELGDYGQALKYLDAALEIHQATGNRWEEINAWNVLGFLYQELGDLATARSSLERGLQLAQTIDDQEGQAYLLSNLGMVVRDQGDLAAAERILNEGLALIRHIQQEDSRYQEAFFASYLSTVALQAGDFAQALSQARTALSLRRELELRTRTADDLATLAAAHLAAGEQATALTWAQEALTVLTECGGQGPEFPQRDYFVCYQVLQAAGQTEPAQAALSSAYEWVQDRAKKIIDPALRQSFLENVVINQEIIAHYTRIAPV